MFQKQVEDVGKQANERVDLQRMKFQRQIEDMSEEIDLLKKQRADVRGHVSLNISCSVREDSDPS